MYFQRQFFRLEIIWLKSVIYCKIKEYFWELLVFHEWVARSQTSEPRKRLRLLQRKRHTKIELCPCLSVLDHSMVVTLFEEREVYFRLLATNDFHIKPKYERFAAARSRRRQNLIYENFTSLFGRLRQKCFLGRAARAAWLVFLDHSTNHTMAAATKTWH